MRNVFVMSRYLIYIAVIGLLLAALAVFVFGRLTRRMEEYKREALEPAHEAESQDRTGEAQHA